MTERMEKLLVLVVESKDKAVRTLFVEMPTFDCTPFRMATDISKIE